MKNIFSFRQTPNVFTTSPLHFIGSTIHQQVAMLPNNAACGNNKRLCRSTMGFASRKVAMSLLLLFALSFGFSSQAWGDAILIKVKGGTIYYDNSKTNWNSVGLIIGRDWDNYKHSKVFAMEHIANTNLFYTNPSQWSDDSQEKENPNYIRFVACSSWETADWGSENYNCEGGYTNIYRANYTFNSNCWYIFTPTSGDNNTAISIDNIRNDQNHDEAWNHTQKLGARVSADNGTTFNAPTKSPSFLRVEGKAFDHYNTCDGNSGNELAVNANYSAPTTGIGFTATAKMIVRDVNTAYTFLGFYDSEGKQLKSAVDAAQGQTSGTYIYEYLVTSSKEVYAYFKENMSTVTLVGCTEKSVSAGAVTKATATAQEPVGMEVTGFNQEGNVTNMSTMQDKSVTFNATGAGTVTAVFGYKTPSIDVNEDASYTIGGAAIKLNPKYTDVAADATYSWSCTEVRPKGDSGATINDCQFSATNVPNPNISADAAGDYTITVTVRQGENKSATETITLTVGTAPDKCATCFPYEAQ